jgi:hypothetical protein
MAINFAKIAKIVSKVVTDLGEKHQVTLTPPGSTTYSLTNVAEGFVDSTESFTVDAVITPSKVSSRELGVDQSRADLQVLIAGPSLSSDPSVGWSCDIDGVDYRVVSVDITRPGSSTLLYTLGVAR